MAYPLRSNQFSATLQFNENLLFESEKFYEFIFRYVVNLDACNADDIEFKVNLVDNNLFNEIIFDYSTLDDKMPNNQWNKNLVCFNVIGGEYLLQIVMKSLCGSGNDGAVFIAVDEIVISEKTDDLDVCKNFQPTNIPITSEGITSPEVSTDSTAEIISSTSEAEIEISTQPTPNDTC